MAFSHGPLFHALTSPGILCNSCFFLLDSLTPLRSLCPGEWDGILEILAHGERVHWAARGRRVPGCSAVRAAPSRGVSSPGCIQDLDLAKSCSLGQDEHSWQSPVLLLSSLRSSESLAQVSCSPSSCRSLSPCPSFCFSPFLPCSAPRLFQAYHHDPGAGQREAGRFFRGKRWLRREGPASVSCAETPAPGVRSAEWVLGAPPVCRAGGWIEPLCLARVGAMGAGFLLLLVLLGSSARSQGG